MLILCYLIVAASFFVHKDPTSKHPLVAGLGFRFSFPFFFLAFPRPRVPPPPAWLPFSAEDQPRPLPGRGKLSACLPALPARALLTMAPGGEEKWKWESLCVE